MNFSDHQIGIYAQGMFTDQRPQITTNLAKLEEQAAATLTPEALGYIVASAGSGSTARALLLGCFAAPPNVITPPQFSAPRCPRRC